MAVPQNELEEAFKFFDHNADGVLTTQEFSTMVRSLGQTPSNLELKTLLKEHCLDENVTMDRVKDMMDSIYQYTAKRDKSKLMDAFAVFDPENTGVIPYEMFEKEILRKIGEPMDEREVADTLKNLEESGAHEGNHVKYSVFVDWVWTQLRK